MRWSSPGLSVNGSSRWRIADRPPHASGGALRPAGVRREIVDEHTLLVGGEPGHAAARELLTHARDLHLPHGERHAAGRVEPVAADAATAGPGAPGPVPDRP